MKILIIEDEEDISSSLKNSLERAGFAVDIAEDGEQGLFLALTNEYDLILLDYMLPKMDGKNVCLKIRQEGRNLPIIMLTVRSEISDKVELLQSGVDDYLTKPFSLDELLARIKAILRRPNKLEPKIIKIKNFKLNLDNREAWLGKERISFTAKEFAILEYLIKNKGRAVSRGLLVEHAWDINADPFSNAIETHILNIRKKIDGTNKNKLIITVPGIGYKIKDD
jgi:DNA-binding response OmpR family regulator